MAETAKRQRAATFLHRAAQKPVAARRVLAFLCAALACTISVMWLDRPLAHAIARLIPPASLVPNVPDTLAPLVAGVSVAGTITWYVARAHKRGRFAHASLLAAVVGPLALGLKYLAKWMFGRPEVQLFLVDPQVRGFHWFAGEGSYIGFPSGHMLVATAWVVSVAAVYPGLRTWGRLALLGLALALLLGSFHFLGDVIAGAFIGAAVAWLTLALDARWPRAEAMRIRRGGARGPP